jgi:hypothetical protein
LKHSHKSIASRSPSLSQEHYLTRHKGSPLRHLPSSLDHLDAASTKDLLHQGRGSPRPPHKVSPPLHTKPEGRRRLPVSHVVPKASGEPYTPWFTKESPHTVGTTLHSLSSKISLALSTYTKHMQVYGWAIKHLDGLDMIFRSITLLCTSTQSNTLKWVSGGGINIPRHPRSRWLKAVESSTVTWFDAMFFRASVHLVLLVVALHCTWPLTQLLWRFIRRTVGSSGAEDLAARILLLASSRPSDEPLLHCQFIVLARLCLVQTWSPDRLMIPSNGPSVHPTLLTSLPCFFNSSGASPKWTVGSSDGACWFQPLRSVLSALTLASYVPSVHLTVPFSFLFFASSTCHCFNLTYLTCHRL